jgi:hypothetical protein
MSSQWRLKGGPELMALLDRIPERLGRNIVRGGLRAAAKVVADEAKLRVGANSIAKQIKLSSGVKGTVVSAKVVVREQKHTKGYAAYFLEYGVEPHWIRTKRKGGLSLGPDQVRSIVEHPGFGQRPFLRPALDAKAVEAIDALGEYVKSRLTWEGLRGPEIAVEEDEE